MMTQTTRVILNAVTSAVAFSVNLCVLFVLTPLMIQMAGKEDFGLWTLVFSLLGFFSLLDLGFAVAVMKHVAECRGADNIDKRNRMVSTLWVVYLLLGVGSTVIIAVVTLFFNDIFSIVPEKHAMAVQLLWILGTRSVILSLPLSLFRGVLFGEQKIYLIRCVSTVTTILYGVFACTSLKAGASLVTVAWINLGLMLIEHTVYVILCYVVVKDFKLSFALADKKLFKEASSFSIAQFMIDMANIVRLRLDPTVIKLFFSLSAVAVYGVALKIAENAFLFTKQFTNILAPLVAELKGAGDDEKIRYVLIRGTKYVVAPMVVLTIATIMHGQEAVTFWVGFDYSKAAIILITLMFSSAISIASGTASNILAMTGHHVFSARVSMLGAVVNVIFSLILLQFFGLVGVALGTLAATIIIDFVIVVGKACQLYKVKYHDFLLKSIVRAIIPGLLQLVLSYYMISIVKADSLLAVVGQALPGVLVYLAFFFVLSLDKDEKKWLVDRMI